MPGATHLEDLLGFVHAWDRAEPMVIHCFAGVSRSTAAAYIAACALNPGGDEFAIARAMRAASPTASPNPRLIALADDALNRQGRMVEAIAAIGRGEACYEGTPFTLETDVKLPEGQSTARRLARCASRRSSSRSIRRRGSSFNSPLR